MSISFNLRRKKVKDSGKTIAQQAKAKIWGNVRLAGTCAGEPPGATRPGRKSCPILLPFTITLCASLFFRNKGSLLDKLYAI